MPMAGCPGPEAIRPSLSDQTNALQLTNGVLGSSSTIYTRRGTFESASRLAVNRRISCSVATACWCNTTAAADIFTQPGVGHCKGYCLGHGRVIHKDGFDFLRRYFPAD